MESKLILRPDFISSASLYLTLKESGFFNSKQVYVLSPADLDFVQVDQNIRKNAFNTAKNLKIKPSVSRSLLIIDGVMLFSKLDLEQFRGTEILFFDTLGLPSEYLGRFDPNKVRYLKIKTPEILYKVVKETTGNPFITALDTFMTATSDYRHVIFGSGLGDLNLSFENLKQEITDFNTNLDPEPLYLEFMPPRHVENCDYLHILTSLDPWEVEFLTSMFYKSTYTNKDLKVLFYVADNEASIKSYNEIAEHLSMHLKNEDELDQIIQPLTIINGKFVSF
jgi:hypothetical protein